MAARNSAKAKQSESARGPAKTGAGSSAGTNAGTGLGDENARLKAELAQAKERIADLEVKQAEIINRIDWVIDSLHNLPD
jgi:hypothetical protein